VGGQVYAAKPALRLAVEDGEHPRRLPGDHETATGRYLEITLVRPPRLLEELVDLPALEIGKINGEVIELANQTEASDA
jgi:hypothetical protein